MLTENDIVINVCSYLTEHGYNIKQALTTTQKGIDIIALKDEKVILIEAKGETSASEGTKRFGKEFNSNQAKHHIAMALYAVSCYKTEHPDELHTFGLAFPKNDNHRKAVNKIMRVIKELDIKIFWVDDTGTVTMD